MVYFFVALKSTFLLLLNNTAMHYYSNFHTSADNVKQIQNGNNGKNYEAVVIKYLSQTKKNWEKKQKVKRKIEKLHTISACPQKHPEK